MKKQKGINPWLLVFRVVFTLFMGCCILFIFKNSLENGAESSQTSAKVLALLNRVMARLHLPELSMHLVRKLAHFAEFMLLGFLMQLCLWVYTMHYIKHITAPLFGCLAVALADETIQLHMAGRSSSVLDVWLDFAGSCAGIFTALCLMLLLHGMVRWIFEG